MNLFTRDLIISNLEDAVTLFKESRDGFLKLFEKSPVCMSMTTTNLGKRVYVKVNEKFLEKFGFSESEIIGRTSVEVGILDQEESVRVGNLIKEKGRLHNDYVKCIAKNGQLVHTVSSIESMEMGGETYLISFFVDITRIMEQQSIIEHHARQLEALNGELEAFSYSVSHDLRAPLRAIDGYIKIIEEDFGDLFNEEGKKALSIVQHNAEKMGRLIDDLLSFARMGQKELLKTEVNMNRLVEEVLADLKLEGTGVQVNVSALHAVKGDYALIKQVMFNLISNAFKYSSKEPTPQVEISSELKNDAVVYAIKDNGVGFDMTYYDKLFGVFQRLHRDEEFKGTGVGLATVQRIVNKHGGSVRAESEPGKGATFSFSLPTGN